MVTGQPIRLKKRKDFVLISDKGTKHVASGLVLQALPNHTELIRVGFTVTKRVGCAVVRNKVRRRLREVVRLSPDITLMKGFDLVIIGRKSTQDRPFQKLLSDLSYALHEAQRAFDGSMDFSLTKENNKNNEEKMMSISSVENSSMDVVA